MALEDPVNWAANEAGLSTSQKRAAAREVIKQEQRDLKEANAGKVDADGNVYVPLVVDGIVGPKTQGARDFVPVETPSSTDGPSQTEGIPEYAKAREILGMTDEQIIAGIHDGSLHPEQKNYPGVPNHPLTGPQPGPGQIWNFNPNATNPEDYWQIIDEYGPGKDGKGDKDNEDDRGENAWLSYQKERGIASTKAMMRGFLNQFGLGGAVNPDGSVNPDLTKWALGMSETGLDGDAIVFEMRYGTDPTVRAAYDSVFPAMAERRKNGYSAITEAEYINLTRGYTQIATAAGIDPDFLAGEGKTVAADGITALIAGDVSLAEWRDRVDLAEWSVTTVDPNVKGILQTTYGYTDQDLVMHFLNPKLAASVKKAQQDVGGAKIISAGVTAIGDTLSRSFADYAYGQDIQGREVTAGLSPYGALTGSTLYEEGMTADEIAWGHFGDSEQRDVLRRERARRSSPFQGAGGLAATSEGIIGAGAVSN